MFYGKTVEDTRAFFFTSWKKYQQKKALLPMEKQIVQVLLEHPEYHTIIGFGKEVQSAAYYPELGETNPFLHMGLHLAVREQIALDRPIGISQLYQLLIKKYNEPSVVEHLIMDQLAECLWRAQKDKSPPDEGYYLSKLKILNES